MIGVRGECNTTVVQTRHRGPLALCLGPPKRTQAFRAIIHLGGLFFVPRLDGQPAAGANFNSAFNFLPTPIPVCLTPHEKIYEEQDTEKQFLLLNILKDEVWL